MSGGLFRYCIHASNYYTCRKPSCRKRRRRAKWMLKRGYTLGGDAQIAGTSRDDQSTQQEGPTA